VVKKKHKTTEKGTNYAENLQYFGYNSSGIAAGSP
jgi:hypothetical protein